MIPLNSGAGEMVAILDTALILQALLHTGQSGAAVDSLKGVNYCDVKICEEILMKSKNYSALLELFKSNSMHHEAVKLLKQLSEESKSTLLKRLPRDALYEERAVILGKMNQHEHALSIYVHKLKGGGRSKKIVAIEGADEMRAGLSSSTDSGRSDVDAEEPVEERNSTIMISEVLDLLSQRWERINGAQALKLLPRETKLQVKCLLILTFVEDDGGLDETSLLSL